jgi:hypothetical protein
MLWTAYVNGGSVPRGTDFVRAVRELAERAGVDPSPLERPQPRDQRADLLREFFDLCRRELAGEDGAEARAYLERRGFPPEAIADSGLGVVPAPGVTRRLLERAGYRPEELKKAGVLADSRWPGRLCGAWRDGYGRIGTLWARSPDSAAAADSSVTSTSAAPAVRICRPTVSPTCLAERRTRGARSCSSKAFSTSTNFARAGSRTSPPWEALL